MRAFWSALAGLALMGMQAPPSPRSAPAPISLWRLDCGEFDFVDFNAFFSDTSEYRAGPKHLVGSCYLIQHGADYMIWDTGLPAGLKGAPFDDKAPLSPTLTHTVAEQLETIGVKPEQIALVGISHYHFDHTGQAGTFPQAKLLIGTRPGGSGAVFSADAIDDNADKPWPETWVVPFHYMHPVTGKPIVPEKPA